MLGERFLLKFKMLLLFIWHTPLQFVMDNWKLLSASTAGYTMTVITNLGPFPVSPLQHGAKGDVPALQLPIV